MSYATIDDMTARYGSDELMRLTDRDGALDGIDTGRLQIALDDAAAEINGHIAKAVTLPLADPPRILTTYACDIAFYRLHDLRGTGDIPEPRRRYDAALSYLTRVSRGDLSLGDETAGDGVQVSPGPVYHGGGQRHMTRDTLRGY